VIRGEREFPPPHTWTPICRGDAFVALPLEGRHPPKGEKTNRCAPLNVNVSAVRAEGSKEAEQVDAGKSQPEAGVENVVFGA